MASLTNGGLGAWVRRLGAYLAAATPAPASADSCSLYPNRQWVLVSPFSSSLRIWESYDFTLVSSTPTFNISDTRIAVNDLDNPISVTFTSSQSRTFSIAVSVSMQAKLASWLTATVSSTITVSRTTQVGVSVTATVPPHAGIRGDYGVQAFVVTHLVRTVVMIWHQFGGGLQVQCFDQGTRSQTVNAPTSIEGWQVRPL